MLSAAALIEALQRRMQLVSPHLRRLPGEFPPGWSGWFAAMIARGNTITGATADSIVDIFLQRPLSPAPRRALPLNRWQAFATLWRQQWHLPDREERKWRWFAGTVTVLWHLIFGAMLLWLMYLQYMKIAPPPKGEDVVQVEFIGTGAPQEVGGGAAEPATRSPTSAPAAAASASATAASVPRTANTPDLTVSLQSPIPEVVQRDVPEPQVPAPDVAQPVTVSEPVPNETSVFVLPSMTPRVREPRMAMPVLTAPVTQVAVADVPEPVQPIRHEIAIAEVTARPLQSRVPQVAQRDVPTPLARVPVPELASRPVTQPTVQAIAPQVRTREVPMPNPSNTSVTTTQKASSAASSTPSSSESTAPSAQPTATSRSGGASVAAKAPGVGPKPAAAAGSWPTPSRGTDLGDSTRNRPGGQRGVPSGVYNSDGSVRLASAPGSASPGFPPGTITQEIANLDRAGTWLKRKPNDYQPTTFDKFWRPNETLLAEWVRKSVSTVRIPIPGTSKTLVCQTVLLALGGGCDISDPNLSDQPANARPPPDIPFKPALQEDNGSVKPAR